MTLQAMPNIWQQSNDGAYSKADNKAELLQAISGQLNLQPKLLYRLTHQLLTALASPRHQKTAMSVKWITISEQPAFITWLNTGCIIP